MRSTTSVGLLIAAALVGTACHTMAPMNWDEVAIQRPSTVWITRANETVQVSGPQVFNDTLVGYVNGAFEELPISDVTTVAVRRPARGKTIALVAASTAAATALAVWIANGGSFGDNTFIDCPDTPDDPRCT
jgi:hypothetical protein